MSAAAHDARLAKFARRKRVNRIALVLSLAAMSFGLFWLAWILWETIRLGVGGLSWATLTQMTPAPNEEGGIANAIYGSFLMVLLATFVGTPIGIMAGIYLAEYNTKGVLASVTRFVNDILLSAPSIVIGLFVYTVVVSQFKGYSGWAGVLALALIVIPGGNPHDRKHAAAGSAGPAGSRLRPGRAEMESHHQHHAACCPRWCDNRHPAGGCANCR
jgi:phosphate transport system permease protein